MKLVLKYSNRWKEFSKNTPINTLNSGKIFMNDLLVEVAGPHASKWDFNNTVPQELTGRLMNWAGLVETPTILGGGSQGLAYKSGDMVLKLTNDYREAQACNLIKGSTHPNVYTIHKVGLLRTKVRPYAIVYEFLDYPTTLMAEAVSAMQDVVKYTSDDILKNFGLKKTRGGRNAYVYNWSEDNIERMKTLLSQLIKLVKTDPSIVELPPGATYSTTKQMLHLKEKTNWSDEETYLILNFWPLVSGASDPFDSMEGMIEYAASLMASDACKYYHQLALGLTFLYQSGVEFDDLKKSNVMQKNGEIAIIDIGYSMVLGDSPNIDIIEKRNDNRHLLSP